MRVLGVVLLALLVASGEGFWSKKVLGKGWTSKLGSLDVYHAGCHSKEPGYGPESNFSLPVDLIKAQKLVKTVKNGKLYTVTLPNAAYGANASQEVYIIHMWGTPYEQGYAQGQMLDKTIRGFFQDTWKYLDDQVAAVIKVVPSWLAEWIANLGLDAALDFTETLTRLHTPSSFYEIMKGMAQGAGVDYQLVVRVHMLAGLTQGKCSTVGLWGNALSPLAGTKLMQLRALDWDMEGPFRDYAALQVYHSRNAQDGNSIVTVGFPGFVGALSGMNDQKMAISEIGVSFPDPSFGKESRVGVPFIFMLREILQFDKTIDSAIKRMQDKRRTCDLILGVGDGKAGKMRGFQYSYSVLNIIDDKNFLPVNSTWHAPIPDTVYFGMDWICPTYNTVLGAQIRKYYGKITPLIARQNITSVEMSGDNHLVWYDLTNGVMWAAFAAPRTSGGPQEAYWREYLEINVTQVLSEPQP